MRKDPDTSALRRAAGGAGHRPAAAVREPEALGDRNCLTPARVADRNAMPRNAVAQFDAQALTGRVRLDAGDPGRIGAPATTQHLAAAGVGGAHGVSPDGNRGVGSSSPAGQFRPAVADSTVHGR
ncbi:hypothetical protein [Streptomyces sp. TLI_171]|uniref:hypothetical protein n=1 Tax=Streptomyces sp. TLI_171 TaxID=1938859 RepID=UPI00217EA412|nr:hypothetical protein [Streptomyces sp. TLI_171]